MKRLNKLGSLLLLFGIFFSIIGIIKSYIPLKSKMFGGPNIRFVDIRQR